MIDPLFQARSLRGLPSDRVFAETSLRRRDVLISVYHEDVTFCRENHVNLSRLFRFFLHDWVHKTLQEEDTCQLNS